MNRYTILGLVVGLLLGVFIGYQAGSTVGHGAGPPSSSVPVMPGAQPMPQGVMPPGGDVDHQRRIAQFQSIVARDPKNVQAWIQLGNDYFDTQQAQKAIEAYGRALELKPNDPNVLTDQGVMYRALGQFEKAIANFEKANGADPKHVQSLFNMGVVYASDLRQPKKAIDAWTRVIQVAPQSEQAMNARTAIDQTKASAGLK
jgi:cytochrome c-type biogenesis protein CcmH/NrfG